MWETWVPSLGREDPLEEEMATHSSILAWRITWTEEPGGLQSMGLQRVGSDSVIKRVHTHTYTLPFLKKDVIKVLQKPTMGQVCPRKLLHFSMPHSIALCTYCVSCKLRLCRN